MKTKNSIFVGQFDEFVWIRCEGKGNFLNSPLLKRVASRYIEAGAEQIIVDLEACTGMDSTFMGTLAGISLKMQKMSRPALQIAQAGEKNKASLEGLGLDALLEIENPEASWREKEKEIRQELEELNTEGVGRKEQAQFCLDAHLTLGLVNSDNEGRFRMVVEMFERDLASQDD